MMIRYAILALAFFILPSKLFSQNSGNAINISLEFLSNLEKGNLEANKNFMAPARTENDFEKKLADSWNYQISRLGAFKNLKSTKYDYFRDYEIVYLSCNFEKSGYTIKIVFNKRQEITDVYFIPYPPLIPAGKLTRLWLIMFFIFWELAWKAMGLWKAGRKQSVAWFVTIFLLPTFGLLPIYYTLFRKE